MVKYAADETVWLFSNAVSCVSPRAAGCPISGGLATINMHRRFPWCSYGIYAEAICGTGLGETGRVPAADHVRDIWYNTQRHAHRSRCTDCCFPSSLLFTKTSLCWPDLSLHRHMCLLAYGLCL